MIFLNVITFSLISACNSSNECAISSIKKSISHNFKYKELMVFKIVSNCVIHVESSTCLYTSSCETLCNTLCSIVLLDHCNNFSFVSISSIWILSITYTSWSKIVCWLFTSVIPNVSIKIPLTVWSSCFLFFSLLICSCFSLRLNKIYNSCIFSIVRLFKSYLGNVITSSRFTDSSYSLFAWVTSWDLEGVSLSSDSFHCFPFSLDLNFGYCTGVEITCYICVTFFGYVAFALISSIRSWVASCSFYFVLSSTNWVQESFSKFSTFLKICIQVGGIYTINALPSFSTLVAFVADVTITSPVFLTSSFGYSTIYNKIGLVQIFLHSFFKPWIYSYISTFGLCGGVSVSSSIVMVSFCSYSLTSCWISSVVLAISWLYSSSNSIVSHPSPTSIDGVKNPNSSFHTGMLSCSTSWVLFFKTLYALSLSIKFLTKSLRTIDMCVFPKSGITCANVVSLFFFSG